MIRRIICESCRQKCGPQHPEDVAMGFKRRIVEITAKKPDDHKIEVFEGDNLASLESVEVRHLPSLMCDHCGASISNGSRAFAVTMWRGEEPRNWESDYAE
jgi:hypothetical protein